MKTTIAAFAAGTALLSAIAMAADQPTAPLSDRERVDHLIRQNQVLIEENARLKGLCERPRTKEDAFAECMQAAKGGTSAMAAESIGGHCDQILKR
ncbi:hypothetical protein [Chitinimonas koreensis]|uniref:hypothetical protein n=1 Tax=Chitinimonas koreensis TaxID=356302 RepID=UPI000491746C|nr:hypothetical protein [Chitinimonas koreensis]QNM96013.1 hypothetical protein H9L41_19675 [Chitinimonas koreensis]